MYLNSKIWHIPTNNLNSINPNVSVCVTVKLCFNNYDCNISFQSLHTILKRDNPTQIMINKHALYSHKIYNDGTNSPDWLDLCSNKTIKADPQMFTSLAWVILKLVKILKATDYLRITYKKVTSCTNFLAKVCI